MIKGVVLVIIGSFIFVSCSKSIYRQSNRDGELSFKPHRIRVDKSAKIITPIVTIKD